MLYVCFQKLRISRDRRETAMYWIIAAFYACIFVAYIAMAMGHH
jgi:hypothetical protein